MSHHSAPQLRIRRPAPVLLLLLLALPALACAGGPDATPEAAVILSPGYSNGSALPAPSGNVVYVNGAALTAFDQAQLEALVGFVPPGRYWLDQFGNFGVEGGPALANLVQLYNDRYGGSYDGGSAGGGIGGGGWIDRGDFGTSGSDGQTCYYNDPQTGASVIVACTD